VAAAINLLLALGGVSVHSFWLIVECLIISKNTSGSHLQSFFPFDLALFSFHSIVALFPAFDSYPFDLALFSFHSIVALFPFDSSFYSFRSILTRYKIE
jgi:hypothetical protein